VVYAVRMNPITKIIPLVPLAFLGGMLLTKDVPETEPTLVQCVPGEVWYSTSYADDEVTPEELTCIDPHSMP
jgi:hypothetical protein